MDFVQIPEKLNLKSENLPETWKAFRQNFEIFLLATESNTKTEPVKVAIFLNAAGPDAINLYNTFQLTGEANNLNRVIEKFENYCTVPPRSLIYDTYLFGKRRQTAIESFNEFVEDLKRMVLFCEFENEDRMLRDRIVFGVMDRALQKRYFACENLDLSEAIEMGRAAEIERGTNATPVEELNLNNMEWRTVHRSNRPIYPGQRSHRLCAYCNLSHPQHVQCPATGQICDHCHMRNHVSEACQRKRQQFTARYNRSS